ncbi:MAG: 6-phosphogluconolactonase [Candidatus Dormibacter sp.]
MRRALEPTVVANVTELAAAGAAWTADRLAAAVADRDVAYFALAGGETPRGSYQRLAEEPYRSAVPWDRVQFYWSDERQVPLDDPASNYAMAKAALLDRLPIASGQVHPLVGDPVPALEQLPRDPQGFPRFDAIHLGLGEDGHTASLFPGDPALEERIAWVVAVHAVKPPPERLSLTFSVLNAARAVLFLVQGAGKRTALAGLLARDRGLPASRVEPADGELRLIVDRAALLDPVAK